MNCPHKKIVRLKQNNGIQETLDKNRQYILGSCTECSTTIVIGTIINGTEYLPVDNDPVCSRCGDPVEDSEHETCWGDPLCDGCWEKYSAECAQDRNEES